MTIRTGDEIRDTIDGSMRPSKRYDLGARIAGPVAKALAAISVAVTLTEVSTAVANVYAAADAAQEEEALKVLFATSASQLGSIAGTTLGSALCAKVTVGSFGVGVATCGVIIGGMSLLGGQTGEAVGQGAYRLIGPAALREIQAIKFGAEKPSL